MTLAPKVFTKQFKPTRAYEWVIELYASGLYILMPLYGKIVEVT